MQQEHDGPLDPKDPDEDILVPPSWNSRKDKIYHDPDTGDDCRYVDQTSMLTWKRGRSGQDWRICRECAGVTDSGGYRAVTCPNCGEETYKPATHFPACDG